MQISQKQQRLQGALGVPSLAAVLIASSGDGDCPFSFVSVAYSAALVSLSG